MSKFSSESCQFVQYYEKELDICISQLILDNNITNFICDITNSSPSPNTNKSNRQKKLRFPAKLEITGFEPVASYMRSKRSTAELYPRRDKCGVTSKPIY